jgi:DNA mismatch repair protein MutS
MAPKPTPMIEQYLAIKERYPDAILFYRMGDFYEMFFEDARTASKALDIALTSRNKNDPNPVPMCGVPCRAVQGYLARLIARGFKVAICDQVQDPAEAKGLVDRDVVRVVTPGMIVENEMLDARVDNFLLAVVNDGRTWGVGHLDISTGTFRTTQSEDAEALVDEIRRVDPNEMLMPRQAEQSALYAPLRRAAEGIAVTYRDDDAFAHATARRRLLEQFGTVSLEGFGCEQMTAAVQAAGALIDYARETQKQAVAHLTGLSTYRLDSGLIIDDTSCQNLDLVRNARTGRRQGSLLGTIDRTVTPMGARRMAYWVRYPLRDRPAIEARLDAVAEALARIDVTRRVREKLRAVGDLERLGAKIAMGQASARDLLALKGTLQARPAIAAELVEFASTRLRLEGQWRPLDALAEELERAVSEDAPPTINEGGMIKAGYDPRLDELMEISRDAKGHLVRIEARERQATGIASLKVRFNKVFGYYIEVPKAHCEKVPLSYVRKQTLVNAERYITEDLKTFETKVLGAEEKRAALELEIFNALRLRVIQEGGPLGAAADGLARIDCLMALAEVAGRNDYCRPTVTENGRIRIVDGRHPVVETMIPGERFVPNTVELDNEEHQVLIITGPNMAGKSTVLRQVALMVLMAQMGGFVPAREAAIGLCDRIFTRVGALDNLARGQSTFMVEMQETANILHHAGPESLVIMDEIGRGTSTYDGLSIAWAVAEHLHDLGGEGVKTLFATHYHELTELAERKPRVKNFHVTAKEWNDEVIFLRKLAPGPTNRSYGIQVARLAGIPPAVIRRAKKILYRIENGQAPVTVAEPSDASARAPEDHKPVQMDLFRHPEAAVIEALKALDVTRMTPLEALNALNRLQKKLGP